jgi:hypothetical protein
MAAFKPVAFRSPNVAGLFLFLADARVKFQGGRYVAETAAIRDELRRVIKGPNRYGIEEIAGEAEQPMTTETTVIVTTPVADGDVDQQGRSDDGDPPPDGTHPAILAAGDNPPGPEEDDLD